MKWVVWFALLLVAIAPLVIIFTWLGLGAVEVVIIWLGIGWWGVWNDIALEAADRV